MVALANAANSPEENGCFASGKSMTPLDAVGYTPVSRDSSEECQAHCKLATSFITEVGHFVYYEPFKLCHCPPSIASKMNVGPEFMSGPLTCGLVLNVLDDASIEVPKPAFVDSRVAAMTSMVVFAAAAVVGSAIFVLRRHSSATSNSWDVEALLEEESRGLQFSRTWQESDSAEE